MIKKLRSIIDYAYENVPIYRKLYQTKPVLNKISDFKKIPYLTINDFALCSIEDVISDVDPAISILPPIENNTISPFPRIESAYDRDLRYLTFRFLLDQTKIKDNPSFLIITNTNYSYFCSEIANILLYYRYPVWMFILRNHSNEEIKSWISKFNPDCLILGTSKIPEVLNELEISNIFTINQYDKHFSKEHVKHFDIYSVTEIGFIGIRVSDDIYVYPDDYFYIEIENGTIVITTLETELQPFIRYKTPDRGQMVKDNMLRISYIGEH